MVIPSIHREEDLPVPTRLIRIFLLFAAVFLFHPPALRASGEVPSKETTVEASCGQCRFHMAGKGCTLAVRVEGKSYFVEGTGIDDHGDAHGIAGFCNAVRKARVKGRVEGEKFRVETFELLPEEKD